MWLGWGSTPRRTRRCRVWSRSVSVRRTSYGRCAVVALGGVHLPTLIFSAKEAVFKAWYPLTRVWLGYQDAEIDLDVVARSFAVRLLSTARVEALARPVVFRGRFAFSDQHVFTVVTASAV